MRFEERFWKLRSGFGLDDSGGTRCGALLWLPFFAARASRFWTWRFALWREEFAFGVWATWIFVGFGGSVASGNCVRARSRFAVRTWSRKRNCRKNFGFGSKNSGKFLRAPKIAAKAEWPAVWCGPLLGSAEETADNAWSPPAACRETFTWNLSAAGTPKNLVPARIGGFTKKLAKARKERLASGEGL